MAGVYISYPFCAQKCTYCNFASGVFGRALESAYPAAVAAEVLATEWQWKPETLYMGGGTPSRAEPEALEAMLAGLPVREWREATMEAAPGAVSAERAAAWRGLGFDRVSLGVQSFVQGEIRKTGRKHTAEMVAEEIARLRAAGIGNVNVDLIAGLPGQTAESWRQSLDWVERLEVPHVSVYMLEVDEDSRLGRELLAGGERYGAGGVPDDDLIADLYETAVERLAAMGISRYEISNFARPGWESRHNLKYWQWEPYVGLGADAHSFSNGMRWWNVESAAEFTGRTRERRPVRAGEEAARNEERLITGLRLVSGLALNEEERAFYEPAIDEYMAAGLLEWRDGRLRLTSRGVPLANDVLAAFLPESAGEKGLH